MKKCAIVNKEIFYKCKILDLEVYLIETLQLIRGRLQKVSRWLWCVLSLHSIVCCLLRQKKSSAVNDLHFYFELSFARLECSGNLNLNLVKFPIQKEVLLSRERKEWLESGITTAKCV